MRLALVWLNMDSPVGVSHGVLILARELTDAGHHVELIHLHKPLDDDQGPEGLVARLTEARVALVGLSFTSPHATEARRFAQAIGDGLPQVHLLCGGIHTTLAPESVLRWPGVDAVVITPIAAHTLSFRPIAVAGSRLLVINTPDARLEVFGIGISGVLSHQASIPVGLEP